MTESRRVDLAMPDGALGEPAVARAAGLSIAPMAAPPIALSSAPAPGPRAASIPTPAPIPLRRIAGADGVVACLGVAGFLLAWEALAAWKASPLQLPSPLAVGAALVELAEDGDLWDNASVSVERLVVSLLVAIAIALPLGFLMGLNRRVEMLFDPVVELLRPISGIAWIPLALFIFGIGNALPIFILVYVATFQLLLNTVAGVKAVDPKLVAAARTMGIRRSVILRKVVAPAALPHIMVGLRLSFAAGWAAIVAAELIGAPSGLGFAIEWYRQLLMSPKVFGFIVVIAVVGYVCDLGLRALQARLTPWSTVAGGR